MVERLLPKQDIVSSNLITRSKQVTGMKDRHILPEMAERRSFYVSTKLHSKNVILHTLPLLGRHRHYERACKGKTRQRWNGSKCGHWSDHPTRIACVSAHIGQPFKRFTSFPFMNRQNLRAGMDVLHLQTMLGHASLDMVQHYA